MKIAIVGPSGSGKSYLAQMLSSLRKPVVHCDEEVEAIYRSFSALSFFANSPVLSKALVIPDGEFKKIDKTLLLPLLKNKRLRRKVEDFVYAKLIEKIDRLLVDNPVVYVDGVLPRFLKDFDQVIYVEAPYHLREQRLMRRGYSLEKIYSLVKMQRKLFPNLFFKE